MSMKLILPIVVGLALMQVSHAQSANDGSEFGRSLLAGAGVPKFNEGDGKAGTFEIAGQAIDISELAPGVSRDQMKGQPYGSAEDVLAGDSGQARFDQVVTEESVQGDVARTVFSAATVSEDEILALVPNMERGIAITEDISSLFTDCPVTAPSAPRYGEVVSYKEQDRTCNIGTVGAACSRNRTLSIKPDALGGLDINDSGDFNAICEQDVVDNQCTSTWICTDKEARLVDGVHVDEDWAKANGLQPLFPGAPALCWSAKLKLSCPVCMEDEFGNQTSCTNVDVGQAEGSTCGALEQSSMCRPVGDTCLLEGEDGGCAMVSRRYTCKEAIRVPTTLPGQPTAVCNGAGGPHAGMPEEGEEMSIQEAMARFIVADTLMTDMSRNPKAKNKPYTSFANDANPNDSEVYGWGYDQDDTGIYGPDDDDILSGYDKQKLGEIQMFSGKAQQCQKGYGGMVDCCKPTNAAAEKLYWDIFREVTANNAAAAAKAKSGDEASGYEILQRGGAGYKDLSVNFTSLRANVLGGGEDSFSNTQQVVWQEFQRRARQELKPNLSPKWLCSDSEFDLAVSRELNVCSYAGTYCSRKVLGACLKKRESYCCYNSPMSKELRRAAEPGGVLKHGTSKSPNCDGIPMDEIDRINWDAVDFSAIMGSMSAGGAFDKVNDAANAEENVTGKGRANANAGRQTLTERTTERLGQIDFDGVRSDIAADVEGMVGQVDLTVRPTEATLSFARGYALYASGGTRAISVARTGSKGRASASVRLSGPAGAVVVGGQLEWSDGDASSKAVQLVVEPGAKGRWTLELVPAVGKVSGSTMVVEVK